MIQLADAVDISIVLMAHIEGNLLLRTLLSLRDAAAYARRIGLTVELICVFDCADEYTRDAFKKMLSFSFDEVATLHTSHGSPALARAAGCRVAHGKYVCLCNGDDLISFNTLLAMYIEAEKVGQRAIIFPEWLFAFGQASHHARYTPLSGVSPYAFLHGNPYTSQAFFSRAALEDIQFHKEPLAADCASEAWHFLCEAVGRKFTIEIAPDAIVFHRCRPRPLRRSTSQAARSIPPSVLFEPTTYGSVCEPWREFSLPDAAPNASRFLESQVCKMLVHTANKIEPQIEYRQIANSRRFLPVSQTDIAVGKAYHEICPELGAKRFAHVFFVPWVTKGGADRYIINLINVLGESDPAAGILVLLGEVGMENVWLNKIAAECTIVDLSKHVAAIGDAGLDAITLKLIQSCAPNAVLHLRTSQFAFRFFGKYGSILKTNKTLVYQFGNDTYVDEDFFVTHPWAPSFITENELFINVFVTDSLACARQSQINTLSDGKWVILPTLCNPVVSKQGLEARVRKRATRVLWASRLAPQKRPALVGLIAQRLAKVLPDVSLDVWGAADPGFDIRGATAKHENLRYRGAYDSFEDVARDDYFCFLYTSLFDGVPTVLLEAAANGLPIVAPDVGGVGLFVAEGKTGILLSSIASDEQMADAYVSAIARLYRDGDERYSLAANALEAVIAGHSTAAYKRSVERMMEVVNVG